MNEIVLCGKPHGCCAKLRKMNDDYIISDDYGGEVYLSKSEINILKKVDLDSLEVGE